MLDYEFKRRGIWKGITVLAQANSPSSACHSNSFFVPSTDRFMISNSQKWCVSSCKINAEVHAIKWLTIYLKNH